MFSKCFRFCVAASVTLFYWLYSRFWLFQHVRHPQIPAGAQRLYAHWHGDELLLIRAYARSRMAIMASRSRDGEFIKWVLTWLGFHVVRGSSTRGGAAGLKGLIDAVKKGGWNASLAVDGPRGPIYRVKPGILKLAQQTQILLIPGAAAASRRFVFKKAWNRCYLPLPFSRCAIVYGEPIQVPESITEEDLETFRRNLERTLWSLKEEAEALFQRTPNPALLPMQPTGV